MVARPLPTMLLGAVLAGGIALASSAATAPALVERLATAAGQARDRAGGKGIAIAFTGPGGWLTRHPTLSGGAALAPAVRAHATAAIAGTPGIGAVRWQAGAAASAQGPHAPSPLSCQEDVEAMLDARTIRFAEASARIDRASFRLLDEIAGALRPCAGSIIAITGHTDARGDAVANLALSQARAQAVRAALVARGIAAADLRATGVGGDEPIERLRPTDPANRRIDFRVIASRPVRPTPIDVPGAG